MSERPLKESWTKYEVSNELNREFHDRYNKAINNPQRRKILALLLDSEEGMRIGEIAEAMGLTEEQLKFHLDFLEWGFCVERDSDRYLITEEGLIVEKLRERGKV